ncbi:MAG: glycosidase [Phycisphaerales bacterium]|nr:glycosidase [Phycisphaerales bacterium]
MSAPLVTLKRRSEQFISDDRRVITRLFIVGDETRVRGLLRRILNMSEPEVERNLRIVLNDFAARHRDVRAVFDHHFDAVAHLLDNGRQMTEARRWLIGAYFTMEYAIEAAALFNPSIVPHFDQTGLPPGARRYILSLRATGEGHISSIVFRVCVIDSAGDIAVNPPSAFVAGGRPDPSASLAKHTFFLKLIEMGAYTEMAGRILDPLPDHFIQADLDHTIARLRESGLRSHEFEEAAQHVTWLARSNYTIRFAADTPPSEVVIFPVTDNESRGIEDARFVLFTDDDAKVSYYGTYTAYNGFRILPQLLTTDDFRTFRIMTLHGKCVQNKGMALFPRKLDGQFVMISRLDGENLHLMRSDNIRFWNDAVTLRGPTLDWEYVQIGNCGSPIETEHGWLLLTHGVGPMRRYCIGADLLDLDDPTRVIAIARQPIISPDAREREGYVPNVVYSCGAVVHNNLLVIPYGLSDSATSFATVPLNDLLSYLRDECRS